MSFIGIDLGGTTIKGGLLVSGRIVRKETLPVNKELSGEQITGDICSLISSLRDKNVQGIGCAVPALIRHDKGVVYGFSNIPGLDDVPLKNILEKQFHVPVCLQNDANCFVLGEFQSGLAKNYRDIVGLITGTGVGAGIIIDEKLYNGTNYGAGEFGMISYKDKNFEAYCSGRFFTSFYNIPGEELAERAALGDADALAAYHEYGGHMGELLKLVCYTLDPQLIVIGGSVSQSFSYYKQALIQSMKSFFFAGGKPAVIKPSVTKDIAIYGAASLCYK
jgi:glucokinase